MTLNLSEISTRDLAVALAARPDLSTVVRDDGMLDGDVWRIRPGLGAVACTDGVAVRAINGQVYGGCIRRLTGRFPNKLAYIGGVVGMNESVERAMRRHWGTDLGFKIELPLGWDHPVCFRQYAPQVGGKNREEFCHDPGKHSFALLLMVVITSDLGKMKLGATEYGGQEAGGLEWYTATTCPPEEDWSYDQRSGFMEVVQRAEELVVAGKLTLPN